MTMNHYKAGSICAVYDCKNYSWQHNSVSFFRFPKEREICAQWVHKCRRADLDDTFRKYGPEKLYKSYKICSEHFQPSDFRNPNLTSQGLRKGVIPSLHLSAINLERHKTRKSPKNRKMDEIPTNEPPMENKILEDQGPSDARAPKRTKVAIDLQIRLLQTKLKNSQKYVSKLKQIIRQLREENINLKKNMELNNERNALKVEIKTENFNELDIMKDELEIKAEDLREPEKMKRDQNISDMLINQHEFGTDEVNILKIDKGDNKMEEKEIHNKFVMVKLEDPNDSKKDDDSLTPVNFVTVKIEYPDNEWDPPAVKKETVDADITEDQESFTNCAVYEPTTETSGENSISQEYILSEKRPEVLKSGMKSTAVKCDVCNKGFNRRDHLRAHYRIHTGEKPYMCDYCNRFFSQSGTLHAHLRIHTGEKPYKCDYCDKTFSVRTNLKSHTKVHTQERLRKCGLCDKVFKMPLSLKTHLKTHAGIRTFKCDECGEDFSKKDGLNKHMRTHTGEKPHKCNICGREFTFGPNLNRHVRSHLRVKPYECNKCDKKYAKSEQLMKHVLTHAESVNTVVKE